MQVIFMDESGYCYNWEKSIDEQPYYVLSAVCLPSEQLFIAYQKIRSEISDLNLEGATKPLGQGFEIKGRDIAKGSSYWINHDIERNTVRDIMLTAPKNYGGTAFNVVINKLAHIGRYAHPADPYYLSLEFIFERLQSYLNDINDYGICIYDQNKRLEDNLQDAATTLSREGSVLLYYSSVLNSPVIKTLKIDRIIEFSLGRSENSLGLQIADFFATMTYTYVKDEKPSPCGWWDELESSLYKKDGKLQGFGYKEFPQIKNK